MYTSFTVRNFRCFRELEMKDLARVNLIAGKNNVGKTALLEALFIHCGRTRAELLLSVDGHRGIESFRALVPQDTSAAWSTVFHSFATEEPIELAGQDEHGGVSTVAIRELRAPQGLARVAELLPAQGNGPPRAASTTAAGPVLELTSVPPCGDGTTHYLVVGPDGVRQHPPPSPVPSMAYYLAARTQIPLSEDAERFKAFAAERKTQELVKTLQVVDPRLQHLELLPHGGVYMIHADLGIGRLVPLAVAGDGLRRLASFVLTIANAPGGVLLVDEIENGFHHSILRNVWRVIAEAAQRFDTQVFAPTHSWECIVAAHEAFSEALEYDVRVHRLERIGEEIKDVVYDQRTMAAALDSGFEVR